MNWSRQRKTWLRVLFASLLLAALPIAEALAADQTDPSFGQNGVALLPQPQAASTTAAGIWDLATTPDGKMVAALAGSGAYGYFGAARFNGDGSLDGSFGSGGFTAKFEIPKSPLTEDIAQAEGVAAQTDGKVVVAGYIRSLSFNGNQGYDTVVVRYQPDASLDPGFGDGGVVRTFVHDDVLHDVAIAPGGRILAVGSRNEAQRGNRLGFLTAYTPDGQFDASFGKGGRVSIASPFPRNGDISTNLLSDIEVLPSGKILVAGYRGDRLLLARVTRIGKLDASFGGGDGMVSLKLRGGDSLNDGWSASLALQPDGRIVVLGAHHGPYRDQPVLARFRPNGRLDRGFGIEGLVAPETIRPLRRVRDVAVHGDGRIVVVGWGAAAVQVGPESPTFRALRYLVDGRLDRSFGSGGLQLLSPGEENVAQVAFAQPDGRVVAAGYVARINGARRESELLLTRYLSGSAG